MAEVEESPTVATSHGWRDGFCALCGKDEREAQWAEPCPALTKRDADAAPAEAERRFFASFPPQEVFRGTGAWDVAPIRCVDGILPWVAPHPIEPTDAEVEALAKVIEGAWGDPTWDGETLRPIDRKIARAVLADGYKPAAYRTQEGRNDD